MIRKTSSKGIGLRLLVIFIIGFIAPALSNSQGLAAKPAQDDILVRWGDQVITKEDVEIRIKALPPEIQEALKDPQQKRQYLESLVQITVTGAEAKAQKLHKKKKVAINIDDTINSILLQEYMTEKIKQLKPPTEEEAKAFFEQNKNEYLTPVFIRARHILIEAKPDSKPADVAKAEAKAKQAYDEVAAGGDFGKLAEKYSDDTDTKTKGGDLGLFQAEQMVPEFSKPVFTMKKGELSKPFRTPFGFHIVKIDDLIPSKQMEFKEVKDDVITRVDNQNRDKVVYGEFDRLKKKYKVKIVESTKEK